MKALALLLILLPAASLAPQAPRPQASASSGGQVRAVGPATPSKAGSPTNPCTGRTWTPLGIPPNTPGLKDFERLLRGDPEMVKLAESKFDSTKQRREKLRVAAILVRLRVPDRKYLHYLITQAKPVIYDKTPWPLVREANSRGQRDLSPAFLKWCAEQHCQDSRETALEIIYGFERLIPVFELGASGSPEAAPLLLDGLRANNWEVRSYAAKGLAEIGDPKYVPTIIDACRNLPPDWAEALAEALLYFDSPEAQKAVQEFVHDPKMLRVYEERKACAPGKAGLFGW